MELPHIQHGCGVKRLRCQWSRPGGVAQHPFSDADPDSLRHEQIPTVLLGVRTHQAAPGGKSDQLNEQWEQMIRIQKIDVAKFVSRLLTSIARVRQYGKVLQMKLEFPGRGMAQAFFALLAIKNK